MIQQRYNCMDDRYKLTREDIDNNGGASLLTKYYHNSPSRALMNVYPEHNWDLDRFTIKPLKFWKAQENHKRFLDTLFVKLGYNSIS